MRTVDRDTVHAGRHRVRGFLHRVLVIAFAGLAASGCAKQAPNEQAAAARQARAQQLVEAGNQAYKLGDYRLAARRYAAAAVENKDDPAAYFGMGMALSKLGRDEEARTAYARSRELARVHAVLEWQGTGVPPPDTIPASHRP